MGEVLRAILGPDPVLTLAAAGLQANLAGAAAILLVVALRLPVRRRYGAQAAYHLWLIPPTVTLAGFALFFVTLTAEAAPPFASPATARLGLGAWLAGVVASGAAFALAQRRFEAELRAGRAGPAVVGFISPRIVMPADDGRFSAEELELIRAHERTHVARKDPRAVAFVAAAECLFWFNPLVHLAARLLRLDQELACDAAVMLSRPKSRRLYAGTLLKTQLAATPLPLGCYWPARGRHPLEVRVALLAETWVPGAGSGGGVVHAPGDAIRP
ncbi:M56 family metallopeptidase [Phenylobacterium sp. VNQ135]|uniref:M56 family metallopeptidase n=1 Tax=Phenylobacterium sp. VNQ135 TaxID=3400922 RepID=UPI003BFA7F7E